MAAKILFNDNWHFLKKRMNDGMTAPAVDDPDWRPVEVPHDWLIHQVNDLYEDGIGWYRKTLAHGKAEGRTVLRFDGVYMDSTLFVNGRVAREWKYGYSTFEADVTAFLQTGDNELMLRVVHRSPNSRWYSGAGLFRNVWLKRTPEAHLASDGIYVSAVEAEGGWRVEVETEIVLPAATGVARHAVRHAIFTPDGQLVAESSGVTSDFTAASAGSPTTVDAKACSSSAVSNGASSTGIDPKTFAPAGLRKDSQTLTVDSPRRWDIDSPVLHTLRTELLCDGEVIETETQTIGFRTVVFDTGRGLFLNGRQVKLFGVCQHHDLGCLGAAFNRTAQKRQLEKLREMGVNAIRTSHNMPAPELMALTDEMGFLVVSEGFDMWERAKTEFDYARFFPEWMPADVASWVRRDRNRPSLLMWSIGNEIYDTHADARGQEVTRMLMAEVRRHDPKENGRVTIGSNYMPWENAQKCADIVKMAGYNYAERFYEEHHAAHPDWVIYGSETSSTVQSRGVYHFPLSQSVLSDDDEQCSALGNSTTSWGAKNSEYCILADRDAAFSLGQFIWTGWDYIGEPTPYHTKNSYFGQIDTAGFPKDQFFLYKAGWTDWRKDPFVHVFPYWDFSPGQTVDVRVVSNAPRVELFLNGAPLGTTDIDVLHGQKLSGDWQVSYEPGELRAVAYDDAGRVIAECVRASFGDAASLSLQADRTRLAADGQDLVFVEISALDAQGRPVDNANNRVTVSVSGAGRLLGLDNGDSTDFEEYKSASRRLFSGRLLAVIGATFDAGTVDVTVSSQGMPDCTLKLEAVAAEVPAGVSRTLFRVADKVCRAGTAAADTDGFLASTAAARAAAPVCFPADEIPVRSIEIRSPLGRTLGKDLQEVPLEAVLHPAGATWRDVEWQAVNDAGIASWIATVEGDGLRATLRATGDGTVRVRCVTRNGAEKTRLISQLDFRIDGLGETLFDPYAFIPGGLFGWSNREMTNGNDHGVATQRDGESQVAFTRLNFGDYGSDEVTIPIFAMEPGDLPIEFWEGIPGEPGSECLMTAIYDKGSIWNVYQEQTFRLPRRLKGVSTLCLSVRRKVHIAGIRFTKREKAFAQLLATECDRITGDTFNRLTDEIVGIGNNVSLEFDGMDFGETGARRLTICGRSDLDNNTIHVQFTGADGSDRQLCEFAGAAGHVERTFELTPVRGMRKVTFIFLPGCRFDFKHFRFS